MLRHFEPNTPSEVETAVIGAVAGKFGEGLD